MVLTCTDHLLHHIVPPDFGFVRNPRKIAAERSLPSFFVVVKEHSGVVHKVGFSEHDLLALRTFDQKRDYAPALLPLRKLRAGVGALEIVDENILKTTLPFLIDIRNFRMPVLRKTEIRLFVGDGERSAGKGYEPVGAGVIVCTEDDLVAAAVKFEFIEVFADLGLLVGHSLGNLINAAGAGATYLHGRAAVDRAVAERHRGLRPLKQQDSIVEHVVADAVCSRNVHFKPSVRRFQGICLRCGAHRQRRSRKRDKH